DKRLAADALPLPGAQTTLRRERVFARHPDLGRRIYRGGQRPDPGCRLVPEDPGWDPNARGLGLESRHHRDRRLRRSGERAGARAVPGMDEADWPGEAEAQDPLPVPDRRGGAAPSGLRVLGIPAWPAADRRRGGEAPVLLLPHGYVEGRLRM